MRISLLALAAAACLGLPPVVQSLAAGADAVGASPAADLVARGSGFLKAPTCAVDLYDGFIVTGPTRLTVPAKTKDGGGIAGVRFTSGNGLPVTVTHRTLSPLTGAIGFAVDILPAAADGLGTIWIEVLPVNGVKYRLSLPVLHNRNGTLLADVRYVDPVNGSDANDGRARSSGAWQTINQAHRYATQANAPTGLFVKLAAGRYNEDADSGAAVRNPYPLVVQPDDGVPASAITVGRGTSRAPVNLIHANVLFRNFKIDSGNIVQFKPAAGSRIVFDGVDITDSNGINGPMPYGYKASDQPQDFFLTAQGGRGFLFNSTGLNYNVVGFSKYVNVHYQVSSDGLVPTGQDFAVINCSLRQITQSNLRQHAPNFMTVASVQFNGPDARYTVANLSGAEKSTYGTVDAGRSDGLSPFTTTITLVSSSGMATAADFISQNIRCVSGSYAYPERHWFATDAGAGTIVVQDDAAGTLAANLQAGDTLMWYIRQHADAMQVFASLRYAANAGNHYFQRYASTGLEFQILLQAGPANVVQSIAGLTTRGIAFTVDTPSNTWTVDTVAMGQGTAQLTFAGDRTLMETCEGTGLLLKTGACVGREYPIASVVNAFVNGSAATVSGSVVSLDYASALTTSNITVGSSALYLAAASGTKSFTITAFDNTAKTVTVSGSPSLPGASA